MISSLDYIRVLDNWIYVPSALFGGFAVLDCGYRATVNTGRAMGAGFFCPCGLAIMHFYYAIRAILGAHSATDTGFCDIKALSFVHGVVHSLA